MTRFAAVALAAGLAGCVQALDPGDDGAAPDRACRMRPYREPNLVVRVEDSEGMDASGVFFVEVLGTAGIANGTRQHTPTDEVACASFAVPPGRFDVRVTIGCSDERDGWIVDYDERTSAQAIVDEGGVALVRAPRPVCQGLRWDL